MENMHTDVRVCKDECEEGRTDSSPVGISPIFGLSIMGCPRRNCSCSSARLPAKKNDRKITDSYLFLV